MHHPRHQRDQPRKTGILPGMYDDNAKTKHRRHQPGMRSQFNRQEQQLFTFDKEASTRNKPAIFDYLASFPAHDVPTIPNHLVSQRNHVINRRNLRQYKGGRQQSNKGWFTDPGALVKPPFHTHTKATVEGHGSDAPQSSIMAAIVSAHPPFYSELHSSAQAVDVPIYANLRDLNALAPLDFPKRS